MKRTGFATAVVSILFSSVAIAATDLPPVTAPPESFFEMLGPRDREVGRQFYKEFIDVIGMPVVAAAEVDDRIAYWAGDFLACFDALGRDATPEDAGHSVVTREVLKQYDQDLFALVHETMAYAGHEDWRSRP